MRIGRQTELAWLEAKLAEGAPLISVVGPPGVGKSRLLQELEGANVCHLADATTVDDVWTAVARACGFPTGLLPYHLPRAGALVLVLDEVEGVSAIVTELVQRWLEEVPELQVVVGSRERLGLEEEIVLTLEPFGERDALDLWLARTQQREEALTKAERADLERLLHALGGLPLAIVLAAARWPLLSPSDLERRTPGVLGGLRDALDRSWEHLAQDERTAFAKLSVFRGGFAVDSAETLLAPANGLELVQALFRKSLIQGRSSRVYWLQPLRELAAEKLRAAGLDAETRQHHEDLHFERLRAKESDIDRATLSATVQWFDDEAQNVFAAMDHALARGNVERGARMATAAAALGAWSVYRGELAQRMRAIRDNTAFPSLAKDVAAAFLLGFGTIGGSGAARLEALEAALALGSSLDPRIQIAMLPVLADAGRADEAEMMLRHVSAGVTDPMLESELERKAASIPHAHQRFDEAIGHAKRALELARHASSQRLEYPALVTLAFLSGEAGDSARALRYGTQARDLLGADTSGDAPLLASQGYAHHIRAEYAEARRFYAMALERLPVTGQLTWLIRGYSALAGFQAEHIDPRDTLEIVDMELRRVAMAHALLFQGYLGAVETLFGTPKSIAPVTALERSANLTKVRLRALEICAMHDVPVDPALDVGIEISVARDLTRRIRERETPRPVKKPVRVAKDGAWFEVDGNRLSCAGRPVMRRMLAALATSDVPLSTDALVSKTWPGERILRDPARNRIRVMIARLRDLGLRGALAGGDAGYTLEAERV